MRRKGEEPWHDVSGARIDPRRAYEQQLPSGRTIALFFYDGPVSRAVAFERLLRSGEGFAHRLLGLFGPEPEPQLVHIATDGETYGHHHPGGDMALAYALHLIEGRQDVRLTNYGEYLERHPPAWQVEILENTSWSCAHGLERWRADCGCTTGGHPHWNQAWRAPLRQALDWLRDRLAALYEEQAGELVRDPWAARDDYIDVILDRSESSRHRFLERHARRGLAAAERVRVWKLLEMQRHAMLMYTSCGWFFEDVSRIETVQILQYAGRVIQIAEGVFEEPFEQPFLDRLARAQSNLAEHGDGRQVYMKMVQPAKVDLLKMAEHYAVISLFEDDKDITSVYCYDVQNESLHELSAGRTRLSVGRARLTSRLTLNSQRVAYAVLHLSDHIITGGAGLEVPDERLQAFLKEAQEAFDLAQFGRLLRLIERDFGSSTFSLASLFKDEQRRVAQQVLRGALEDAEATYRRMYEDQAPLLHFLHALKIPAPRALYFPVELVLNADLVRELRRDEPDVSSARSILERAEQAGVELDATTLGYVAESALARASRRLAENPGSAQAMRTLALLAELVAEAPFEVRPDAAQNALYEVIQQRDHLLEHGRVDDVQAWQEHLARAGRLLRVRT
ncbi:MAG: glycoside hydrolase [Phycisphaerales bacterium]|nr:MAG: glycoside hydrolase [Phycisphaerales bacterium]